MPNVIALSGKQGSGKDAVAQMLYKNLDYSPIAIADLLRRLLLSINPIVEPLRRLNDIVSQKGWTGFKKTHPNEYRQLMTGLGSKGLYAADPSFLVNAVIGKIMDGHPNTKWVVSDVRMPSEYWALRKMGAQMWRIHRPLTDKFAGDDVTETALDTFNFDVRIYNDSDLHDLEEQVMVQHERSLNTSVPF